jgi:integrase/recombinase XerD
MNFEGYAILFQNELELKVYSPNTIKNYLSVLNIFLHHFEIKLHPKNINEIEIKDYLRSLSSVSQLKQNIGCLKLFYKFVIRQPLKFKWIEYPRKEHKLPDILSPEEVGQIISVCTNIKHKTIILLLFETGLRVNELINLRIRDIDSSQMIIRIKNAKGNKDRIVPLSKTLLSQLRTYYQQYKPKEYLFNGQFDVKYTASSIRQFLKKYAKMAGITKNVRPHIIRHSSFSEMLNIGNDLRSIQVIAGHSNIKTTSMYLHLSSKFISQIRTPQAILT